MVTALALVILFILGLLFLVQSRFSSQAARETRLLGMGDRVELIADSAIEEAMAVLRQAVEDPSSEAFASFRKLVYAPKKGEMDLLVDHPYRHTQSLLKREASEGIELDPPEVRVVLQRQIDSTAYERRGILRYRATARMGRLFGRRVIRRIERVQSFKVALAGMPMPHCSYGVFLAHLDGLIDTTRVNGLRQRLMTELGDLRRLVAQVLAAAPDAAKETLEAFQRSLLRDGACERAKELPRSGVGSLYGLIRQDASLQLENLELAGRLSRSVEAAKRLAAAARGASRNAAGLEALRRWDGAIRKGFWDLWAFNRVFRVLPDDHAAYAPLKASFYKFDPSFWLRRAQYRVRPRAGEKDMATAWERFRQSRSEVHGVIAFDNSDEVLTLTGRLRGQACLVVGTGGLLLEDFNGEGPSGDVITIVSLGGPVKVRGTVRCALVLARADAVPHRLHFDPDCSLHGAFSAYRLPQGTHLAGRLVRNTETVSGRTMADGRVWLDEKRLHVVMAPRCLYRKVLRR